MIFTKKRVHVLFLLAIALCATAWAQRRVEDNASDRDGETKQHYGYPQDWSSRHLVMTGDQGNDPLRAGSREPRHVYNRVMREMAREGESRRHRHPPLRQKAMKVDWAVSLENGFVPANMFPAKYRFDVTTESCAGDYVVFGLTVNTGTQANLVGINNLYTEASPKCNGGTPFVSFAYNTVTHGGQIRTSPTISADGLKVAFVESTSGGSYFHVLVLPNPLPSGSSTAGTVLGPVTPTSCTTPTTVGCMTTTAVFGGTNTDSSPWIDYTTDIAYVGTDDGKLYKISPVFGGGAPTVASDTNWPVTVVTNPVVSSVVTDPIVDDSANRIFMGDANGYLYAVNLTAPAKATAARVVVGWVGPNGPGIGLVDPPIVVNDSANPLTDQVFAFTGCSNVIGIGGAISQLSANFASGSCVSPTTAGYVAGYCTTVDMGSASNTTGGQPAGDCTTGNVHSGTFDNQFWTNGSTGGHMLACGFVQNSGTNWLSRMYMFPFNSSHLISSTGATGWNLNSARSDECSPLTEFSNGTTDRMFFGVGGTGDGFVESSTLTATASQPSCGTPPSSSCVTSPHALGGTSGIIVDNQLSNGGTNIYFTTLAVGGVNGQNCATGAKGASKNPFCAVKLTQSGLQ